MDELENSDLMGDSMEKIAEFLDVLTCKVAADELKEIGGGLMLRGNELGLNSAMTLGGIVNTLAILSGNKEDLAEFSELALDFIANKLRLTLSKGDSTTDVLLDLMNKDGGDDNVEAIKFLDSKLPLSVYKKNKKNNIGE